jgi:hypothetical protein
LLACSPIVDGSPFRDDVEARPDLEQFLQEERARLTRWFLEREHFHVIVVEPQVTAVSFDLRVAKLEIEVTTAFEL